MISVMSQFQFWLHSMTLPEGEVFVLVSASRIVVNFFVFTFSQKFVNTSPDAYTTLIPIMQGEL